MGRKAGCSPARSRLAFSFTCTRHLFNIRKRFCSVKRRPMLEQLGVLCAVAATIFSPALYAADQKLTEDDRVEILRGLTAEYATVKVALPRSPKPLPFDVAGTWDK